MSPVPLDALTKLIVASPMHKNSSVSNKHLDDHLHLLLCFGGLLLCFFIHFHSRKICVIVMNFQGGMFPKCFGEQFLVNVFPNSPYDLGNMGTMFLFPKNIWGTREQCSCSPNGFEGQFGVHVPQITVSFPNNDYQIVRCE